MLFSWRERKVPGVMQGLMANAAATTHRGEQKSVFETVPALCKDKLLTPLQRDTKESKSHFLTWTVPAALHVYFAIIPVYRGSAALLTRAIA